MLAFRRQFQGEDGERVAYSNALGFMGYCDLTILRYLPSFFTSSVKLGQWIFTLDFLKA